MIEAPDLRDDAAEAGHHGRQERQARLLDEEPDHLEARRAQGEDLEAEVRRQVLDGRQGDPRDDRGGDDGLGQDDGRRGVEDLQETERPVPPEEDRHEEAHDDRREAHPRVDQAHDELPARETGQGHDRPDGDPDEEADQRRRPRHLQRQERDPQDLRVQREDEIKGLFDAFQNQIHRLHRLFCSIGRCGGADSPPQRPFSLSYSNDYSYSGLPASGKKSGPPYFSTPKVLMIPWVSAETMKSEKAFAPSAFTFGHLAGFTWIT